MVIRRKRFDRLFRRDGCGFLHRGFQALASASLRYSVETRHAWLISIYGKANLAGSSVFSQVDYIDPTLPLNQRLSLQLTPGEMDSLSTLEGLMGFVSSIEKSDRQDRPYLTSRLILLSRLAYLASSRRRFNEPDGYLEALLKTIKDLAHPSYYKAMFSSMVNATKTMPSKWDYGSLCNKGKGGLPSPKIRIDRDLLPRLVSDNMDRLLPTLSLLKYLLREVVSKESEAGAELSLFDTIAADIRLHFRREYALLPLRRILEYAVESKSKAVLSSLSLEQVYGVFEKLYADWQ